MTEQKKCHSTEDTLRKGEENVRTTENMCKKILSKKILQLADIFSQLVVPKFFQKRKWFFTDWEKIFENEKF